MSLRVLGQGMSPEWKSDGTGFQWEGWAQRGGTPGLGCLLEKWPEDTEDPLRARKHPVEL